MILLLMVPWSSVCVGVWAKLRDWSGVNYSTTIIKCSVLSCIPPQTSPRQRWGSSATWPSCSSACPTRQSVPSSPPSSLSFPSLLNHSSVSPPPTPAYTLVSLCTVCLSLFFSVCIHSFISHSRGWHIFELSCESVQPLSPEGRHGGCVGASNGGCFRLCSEQ